MKQILESKIYFPWSDTRIHKHFLSHYYNIRFLLGNNTNETFLDFPGVFVVCHYTALVQPNILPTSLSQSTAPTVSDLYLNFIEPTDN